MITVGNKSYELIHEYKDGWNQDSFRARYSEVLERYDYIVGDWGYNQLRLRGFFRDNHPKASKDALIGTVQDYLNEYCNFGCAYFVLQKLPSSAKERKTTELEHADKPNGESTFTDRTDAAGMEKHYQEDTPDVHDLNKDESSHQAANRGHASSREFHKRDTHRGEAGKREHGRSESAKSGFRGKPKHNQGNSMKKQAP